MGLPQGDYQFYRGTGCSECFHTGYRGRTGVFEILTMAPDMRHAIHQKDRKAMEEAVRRSTFRPILEDCAHLVAEGITTTEEIVKVIGGQVK